MQSKHDKIVIANNDFFTWIFKTLTKLDKMEMAFFIAKTLYHIAVLRRKRKFVGVAVIGKRVSASVIPSCLSTHY